MSAYELAPIQNRNAAPSLHYKPTEESLNNAVLHLSPDGELLAP